jgi:hypothetical protein
VQWGFKKGLKEKEQRKRWDLNSDFYLSKSFCHQESVLEKLIRKRSTVESKYLVYRKGISSSSPVLFQQSQYLCTTHGRKRVALFASAPLKIL